MGGRKIMIVFLKRIEFWGFCMYFFFLGHISAQINQALVLDGCNNYLEINENDLLDYSNVLSIEAWIRPNCDDQNRMIVSKEWCQGEFSYYLSVRDGKLNWRYSIDGGCIPNTNEFNTMNVVIPPDIFTHVAIVHNTSSIKLFINGVQVSGSQTLGSFGSIHNSTEPLRIGCYRTVSGNYGNFFSGMIDELRLWNIELNETLIQQRMNSALNGNEAGLVVYHDMEDVGSGSSLVLNNKSNYGSLFDASTIGSSSSTPYLIDANSYDNISLLNDVSINCEDPSIPLSIISQPIIKEILWSTGETTENIAVDQPGTYTLWIESELCRIIYDTITIVKSQIELTPESYSICVGQSIELYGTTFFNTGNYSGLLPGIFCDTIYDITITMGVADTLFNTLQICEDDTPQVFGTTPGNTTMITWASSGDGIFNDINNQNPIYSPGTTDIMTGSVTLSGTTDDPDGIGSLCPTTSQVMLTIIPKSIPTFNIDTIYCEHDVPDFLPLTSTNGITGTWTPTTISTSILGSTDYTFTPNAGQCATELIQTILVHPTPDLSTPDTYTICVGETFDLTTVNIVDNASSGATYTYHSATPTTSANQLPSTIVSPVIPTTYYILGTTAEMCIGELAVPVVVTPTVNTEFTIDTSYCVGDVPETLPLISTNGVAGTWLPSAITTINPGTTVYTFTPSGVSCATSYDLTVVVEDCDCQNPATIATTPTITICQGEDAMPQATLMGTATIVTWSTNGDGTFDDVNSLNPIYTPGTADIAAGTVLLTGTTNDPDGAGPCSAATSMTSVTISTQEEPAFNIDTAYCVNESPDLLPLTSTNGITGTWTPDIINTAIIGSIVYTFDPAVGQCASSTTITVNVEDCACPNPPTVVITDILSVCELDQAMLMATLGGDATTVTWGTLGDGFFDTPLATSTNYTFGATDIANGMVSIIIATNDPDGVGPCVPGLDTLVVDIDTEIIPTFTISNTYCVGDTTESLPTTSLNGITGTWNQDTVATTAAGNATYTFSPDAQFCARDLLMSVTVNDCACPNPAIVSVNEDLTICPQLAVDITANISGGASNIIWTTNGDGTFGDDTMLVTIYTPGANDIINGTVVLTATTDDPDGAGPCVTASDEIVVMISSSRPSEFSIDTTYCLGEIADLLPTTSNNGVNGIWMPTAISTATVGFTAYTFMPGINECADTITINVEVSEIPDLSTTANPEICAGEMIRLDTIMINDANGTNPTLTYHSASPATTANMLTSTTVSPTTSTTYYVVGTNNGCTDEIAILVTVTPAIIPEFDPIKTMYCVDETAEVLPNTTNGITGTWSPTVIDVSLENTTNYTFTPDGGQCAVPFDVLIEVEDCPCATPPTVAIDVSVPTDICFGELINLIASIGGSANSITWTTNGTGVFDDITSLTPVYTPSMADSIAGSVLLTATTDDPDGAGPCLASFAGTVVNINPLTEPSFNLLTTYCLGETAEVLPTTSMNGLSGTWNPTAIATDQVGTTNYVFTPNTNCSQPYSMNVSVQLAPNIQVTDISMICPGESIDLATINIVDANNSGANITYHSASPATIGNQLVDTEVSPPVNATYYALAQVGNCTDEIPILVNIEESISPILDIQQPDCNGENAMISILTVNGVTLPLTGTLSDGQTFDVTSVPFDIIPNSSGLLTLDLTSINGCSFSQDINMMSAGGGGFISIEPETIILSAEGPADIIVTTDVDGSWTWLGNPDLDCDTCAQTILNVTESKAYTIEIVDDNGCIYRDIVIVQILEPKLYIPNAFSPNNDGLNDFFVPFAEIEVDIFEFKVFNRWGDLVYAREKINLSELDGWNGYFNQKLMTPDAFTYYIKGQFETGQTFFYSGEVYLMR